MTPTYDIRRNIIIVLSVAGLISWLGDREQTTRSGLAVALKLGQISSSLGD